MKSIGGIIAILIFAIAWFIFGVWVIQLNVNDIASYYQQDQAAPFWPFFWIMLFGGGSAALGKAAS